MSPWIFVLLLLPAVVFSDEIPASYAAGVKAFQDSNFDKAKDEFTVALKDEPENPLINYNLGLTEWKLGHPGAGLAMLRRAQYYDPSFRQAFRAEMMIKDTLKVKDLPHQISIWESLRDQLLKPISLEALLLVSLITLAISAFVVPRYLAGLKKWKDGDQLELPSFVPSLVASALFLSVFTIAALKLYDTSIQRATIVSEKIEARAGPDVVSAGLFDLFEGLEVIVRRTFLDSNQKEWVQVSYPGGSTGWVPRDSIVSHSEWK